MLDFVCRKYNFVDSTDCFAFKKYLPGVNIEMPTIEQYLFASFNFRFGQNCNNFRIQTKREIEFYCNLLKYSQELSWPGCFSFHHFKKKWPLADKVMMIFGVVDLKVALVTLLDFSLVEQ